jgi:hypothetical protein
VLQYVPIGDTLNYLYSRLNPGGRLVAMFPNRECPIVKRTTERCEGQYVGITVAELRQLAENLSNLDFWACRGLAFIEDQRLAPYEISALTQDPNWPAPPNRLLFVAAKRESQPAEQ